MRKPVLWHLTLQKNRAILSKNVYTGERHDR